MLDCPAVDGIDVRVGPLLAKLGKLLEQVRGRGDQQIGELLVEIEEICGLHWETFAMQELGKWGVSKSRANVLLRWAKGDYGEHAAEIVYRVNSSVLCEMSNEAAQSLYAVHPIKTDPPVHIADKHFRDMSDAEISRNCDRCGFVKPGVDNSQIPPFRASNAVAIECVEDGAVVFRSGGADAKYMRVPHKLLKEAAAGAED